MGCLGKRTQEQLGCGIGTIILQNPSENSSIVLGLVSVSDGVNFVLHGAYALPPQPVSCLIKWHLSGCRFRPVAATLPSTSPRDASASSNISAWTKRYNIRHSLRETLSNTLSMSRSNVAGALQSPNGRTLNCQSPLFVRNVVLGADSGDHGTCQ